MAQRLLGCGVRLAVNNRTRSKADALLAAGAAWIDTPAELTAASDIIVSCLHGPDSDRAVFLGEGRLLSVAATGKLVVNTSTIGPDLAIELAAAARAQGRRLSGLPADGRG